MPALLYGEMPEWATATFSGYGDGDGYGDGSGYGYGDGSGYGYGDGDGYGDGSGYGYGDGYGYGYGDGYGSGSGYGSGYGSGSGYGDGDGSGYGSGYGYWKYIFESTLNWPRVKELMPDPDVSFGYWRSSEKGLPSNGGSSNMPATAGLIQEIKGPLGICTRRALHATISPEKWKGERLWLVALFGEVQRQEDKMGALKREILGEIVLPKCDD